MTEIKTNFKSSNEFHFAGIDIRMQTWIDVSDTYYSTYIDFDNLKWIGAFW